MNRKGIENWIAAHPEEVAEILAIARTMHTVHRDEVVRVLAERHGIEMRPRDGGRPGPYLPKAVHGQTWPARVTTVLNMYPDEFHPFSQWAGSRTWLRVSA